jgi:acyl-CoA reductase-like NAD-dependent aldehyde dehydrogenase
MECEQMCSNRLLIDRKLTAFAQALDVIHPATGAVLARCARASTEDVDAAVDAAR